MPNSPSSDSFIYEKMLFNPFFVVDGCYDNDYEASRESHP